MRRGWAAAVAACGTAAALVVVPASAPVREPDPVRAPERPGVGLTAADYDRVVADEAYWVSTAQLTCTGDGAGAIAEAPVVGAGPVSVHPYEASIGARAMLAAGGRYLPMVGAYVRWYLRHLNRPDALGVAGTVHDHDYDPLTCTGRPQPHPVTGAVPKYDSSDAYAGTFLSLVAGYARADPGAHAFLRSVRARLDLVADAIGATRMPSGLTGATRAHPAEYLMDNVEAARGLADYARLLDTALDDPAAARRRAAEADAVHRSVETVLWVGSTRPGMYGWAADRLGPAWEVWYPDAVAQLWPVWDGLGPPERRAALWAEFARRWPRWTASTPAYGRVSVEHDPNASAAYAAARVGDRAALDAYLRTSEITWAGRPPPWTVDDSGFRALAAATGRALLPDA